MIMNLKLEDFLLAKTPVAIQLGYVIGICSIFGAIIYLGY